MKRKKGLVYVLAALLLALAAYLSGCGSSGSSDANSAVLKVSLTDRQSDDVKELWVTIREVRAVPNGRENAPDGDPGLPLLSTFPQGKKVDIMKLRFLQEALGEATVPVGVYNQVRLVLEANPKGAGQEPVNYVVLSADPTRKSPLDTPSAQQSGLKILGKFEVKAGIINAIMLDFDPNTAIVGQGNGGYSIKPTGIRIIQLENVLSTYGSLSGLIMALTSWSEATVSVVPQGSSSAIAAGSVFSTYTSGSYQSPFTAFVPAGNYRVHVVAPGYRHYSSPFQTVTTGVDTPIGTVTLTQ